jgi:hypothetical protein
MGYIKQAGVVSAMEVLLHNTVGILDRHQVAGKGNHLAIGGNMLVIEAGLIKCSIVWHSKVFWGYERVIIGLWL